MNLKSRVTKLESASKQAGRQDGGIMVFTKIPGGGPDLRYNKDGHLIPCDVAAVLDRGERVKVIAGIDPRLV